MAYRFITVLLMIFYFRLIISMLQQHTRSEIACSECTQVLFKKSNLFTVPGACGMVGSYVNSMGYVRMIQNYECDV